MKKLVVVGNGMAGVGCVEQILRHAPAFDVTILGEETHVNYNRILLSSVLAGEKPADEITLNPLEWYRRNDIRLRLGVKVTDVDAERRTVTVDDGSVIDVRHAAARDRELGVQAADCRDRQGRRVRVSHARRHPCAAQARRAPACGPWSSAVGFSASRRRAVSRCRAARSRWST